MSCEWHQIVKNLVSLYLRTHGMVHVRYKMCIFIGHAGLYMQLQRTGSVLLITELSNL